MTRHRGFNLARNLSPLWKWSRRCLWLMNRFLFVVGNSLNHITSDLSTLCDGRDEVWTLSWTVKEDGEVKEGREVEIWSDVGQRKMDKVYGSWNEKLYLNDSMYLATAWKSKQLNFLLHLYSDSFELRFHEYFIGFMRLHVLFQDNRCVKPLGANFALKLRL